MGEIRPKTIHTNSAAKLRALRKVLVKFNERALQAVEKDMELLSKWDVHEPKNVSQLRKQLLRRAQVAMRMERRLKDFAKTGEKKPPDDNNLKLAVLAAIVQYHDQEIYNTITGADGWDL